MQQNNHDFWKHDAALLYCGQVMHMRLHPFQHRFKYKVFSLLIDLDRLEEANKKSRIFSINSWNIISFFPSDHGSATHTQRPQNESLKTYIDHLLRKAGLNPEGTKAKLLCYPRIFGHVFNPISVYFIANHDDELIALIYEVRNTFGDIHTYVAPVETGQKTKAGIRQEKQKRLYVSPFMPMDQQYRFRIHPPDKCVKLRILEMQDDQAMLSAVFHGTAQHMNGRGIFKALLLMGFFSFKVFFAIHWEALKLWLKGAKYIKRPKPKEAVSYGNMIQTELKNRNLKTD